jgi:hypothetical protein
MSNPFEGIITQGFKDTHKYMIDALLEDTALTVECTLHYLETKFTVCTNCYPNNIGGKSSNIYRPGGPIPFSHGLCPYCNGLYKISATASDTLYLMTIWDSKRWLLDTFAKTAKIDVQTMSKITTYGQLHRASKVTLDASIKNLGITDFVKVGDPKVIGYGGDHWIIYSWVRT